MPNCKIRVLCILSSVFYGVLPITISHSDVMQNVNVGLPNKPKHTGLQLHAGHAGGSEAAEGEDKFCNIIPTDVVLSRSTENRGFHRDIATHVNITFAQSIDCTICWVLLAEVIPPGMYVDLHQLKSAEPFGEPKVSMIEMLLTNWALDANKLVLDNAASAPSLAWGSMVLCAPGAQLVDHISTLQVLAFEDIDVEKPAYLSSEHTILVYVPHPLRVTVSQNHTIQVKLPIHLRYHKPSVDPEVTSALVQLQHPYVMIRCQGSKSGHDLGTFDLYQAPCDSSNTTMCAWQDLKYHSINDRPLRFQVPVGQQNHTAFVAFFTIAAAVTGMMTLLWVIFSSEKNKIT